MKTWLISDTHFGHENIINHCNRPYKNALEMDEDLIYKWNARVNEKDKVYHLGDFGGRNATEVAKYGDLLNGRKILIKGNHDTESISAYLRVFSDIRAVHLVPTGRTEVTHLLLSHIPVHHGSIRDSWVNIHGHIHNNYTLPWPYINISAEVIGYAPIDFNEIVNNACKMKENKK